jgi:hypothetical protein
MGPGVVMASVAVSVLNWLALSYIVWCIRTGNGEHLFRRRGFRVKWCAGMGGRRVLSHSLEDAGTEHDDSATKMNGMADASRPLAQMLTVLIEPGPRWICNIYYGGWLKFLYT